MLTLILPLASSSLAATVVKLPYRPFIDPINLHDRWWLTLIPLALGISLAYKAVRVKSFDTYAREVLWMTTQIVGGMALLAALLYVFVDVIVPWLS